MKKFMAVFVGSRDAMDAWMKLPERPELEKQGMAAWMQWTVDHKDAVVDMGAPLGKTLRVSKEGITDYRNDLGAYTLVQAETQEEAAQLFEGHPHFTIFPGEAVEVMECLPIPGM